MIGICLLALSLVLLILLGAASSGSETPVVVSIKYYCQVPLSYYDLWYLVL